MYKTEVDLGVVRPHTQQAFRPSHQDSIPALSCESAPGVCLISPFRAVGAVRSRTPDPVEDGDSEVKVETKSIGKISALITRFNDGESGVIESKIPIKKFRLDLENVHKRDVIAREKTSALSDQGDEVPFPLGSETRRLKVVEMNFKLPTEICNPKEATVDTNISTRHKQVCALRVPPKPSPKPKLMKNLSRQEGVVYLQNKSETSSIRPSELRQVFYSANSEFRRRDTGENISFSGEYENGRNTFVHAAVSVRPSSQNEHNLTHSQNTQSAGSTELLPKDNSNVCKIHNKYENLSKDHHQEKATKSLTDYMEEKQRKATVIKPSVLPRYVGIKKHKQTGINETLVTSDGIPESVATLDVTNISCNTLSNNAGGQLTTSDRSSCTSDHGGVFMTTEEPEDLINNNKIVDVASTEKENITVRSNMENCGIFNNTGSISKMRDCRNANMADNYRRHLPCLDNSPSTEPSVGCCTSHIDSRVGCCTSHIDSRVDGCTIPTESSSDGCTTSTDSTVTESPTSSEPGVGACPPFSEPSVAGCTTSTGSTVTGCTTSTGSTVTGCTTSTGSTVTGCTTSTEPSVTGCSQRSHNTGSDTISTKLDMLKSELMAMRKMDLVLLRQLINISQAIQRIQRSDLPKMSRSLTILSSRKTLQTRHKPVERQNSAPHCADRRRFLFSSVRWKTDEDNRDSLSSFDESEFDSQSELEESSSSLNSNATSVSRPFTCPRILFQSCNIPLSLDISEEADQSYEDILKRNVRLWKMGFQRHESLQEELDVWF